MRVKFHGALAVAIAALFGVLTGTAAEAGVLEVRPTMLIITPSQRVGVLALENPEATSAAYQINVYSWHQKGDEQVLEPTSDMIVSPPIINLAGHASQIVRVGLRSLDIPAEEQTYRLILEEIPAPDPLRKPGLNIALRISLPLFVRPLMDIPPAKLKAGLALADHQATVTIHNLGHFTTRTTQAILHGTGLGSADGITVERLSYILPGGWTSYSFDLPRSVTALRQAHVTVQTEEGLVDLAAPTNAEAPSDGPLPPQP